MSALVPYEPPLSGLEKVLEQMLNASTFGRPDRDITNTRWPRVDIVEEADAYILQADLPGVEKDDIRLVAERGILTVGGEKKEGPHRGTTGGYAYLERRFGQFSRDFSLPDTVDAERITADYRNGVLRLTIPKAVREPPRKIDVKAV
jgi:HSP20 family protein